MSGASGVVQLLRGQGEKVAKGKDLAVVYQDETYVASQEELLQVQTDLTAFAVRHLSGVSLWHGAFEEQMLSSMTSLSSWPPPAGTSAAWRTRAPPTASWSRRREYLLSSNATAAMTQAAAQLQSRYDELQAHQSKASSIQAPVSGLFSSYVDGYETVLTPCRWRA
ncbi:MAG: hypothetical protein ACLUNZ_02310 [Evtepia sp.]